MAQLPDEFNEILERERKLMQRLGDAPPVLVSGVVDPSGAGGGKARGEELWTYTFRFAAWRVEGGAVRTDPLVVRKKVTDREMDALRKEVVPYRVLRIRARVSQGTDAGGADALLIEILADAPDAELRDHAKRLQEPVTYQDPQFGTFTLNRSINWYVAEPRWGNTPIELNLSAKTRAELEGALATARALWKDQAGWDRRVREYAVRELLPLKNDNWLEEDEPELSADDFLARMKLESITADADGTFDFWHNDGNLFWGHAIQVSGSLADGPTDADIPG